MTDYKNIIENVEKMNLQCDFERCDKFLVTGNDKKTLIDDIHNSIQPNTQVDLHTLITLYAKIVNPSYLKRQLLEFELDHISISDVKSQINSDTIKQTVLNILSRYHSDLFDDTIWIVEESKKNIRFKNTCLNIRKHDTKMYIKKIRRVLRQLYPDNNVDYYFNSSLKHSERCVFELRVTL